VLAQRLRRLASGARTSAHLDPVRVSPVKRPRVLARAHFRAGEVADPDVGEGDGLVRVHAASVNLLDSMLRSGDFKFLLPYRPPFVLGHDVAGVVLRVGTGVRSFKPGDEVYARTSDHRIGTFAELIAVR
jgi:NADPH:quinone reductase-like Zn-dependent oxidoreductase